MSWKVILSQQAVKDAKRLRAAGLKAQASSLLDVLRVNPLQNPPAYEKLVGNLKGFSSRRINIKHRLVYSIDQENGIVRVLRMWTHYE